mgnify:FL=1
MRTAVQRRGALALCVVLLFCLLAGCTGHSGEKNWSELTPQSTTELKYAKQFTIEDYGNGLQLITIAQDRQYLLVPEGAQIPAGVPEEVTVLQQPIQNIYLTATAAMDLFRALDGLDAIRLSGTKESGWYLPEARQAMEAGDILYAGKYSAPDYELILAQQCGLAVESTMIYHNPEVKEQLESLGIPVLVDYSSYESDPLGRMEWIKLYGALLGKEEEAARIFDEEVAAVQPVLNQTNTGKTVAFFYITNTGTVNVRKSGDYIAQLIRMAGGVYVPDNQNGDEENALSTMNIDMESFYAAAHDADVLIYNSTIDGELASLDELLKKSELLADFKAVQNGEVWCTGKNMFQSSMSLGRMILEINAVLTQQAPGGLTYLYRLS